MNNDIKPGLLEVKSAQNMLRKFEHEARMTDLVNIDERLRSSEISFRFALASELMLLAILIAAATWIAIDIVAKLPHHN